LFPRQGKTAQPTKAEPVPNAVMTRSQFPSYLTELSGGGCGGGGGGGVGVGVGVGLGVGVGEGGGVGFCCGLNSATTTCV
jgi:hypothetical protein